MAKKSSIEKNKNRQATVKSFQPKRQKLNNIIKDKSLPAEERFKATIKLASLPRNGAKIRLRNRCEITGRPRGYYRKFKMSRISLRELSLMGFIPGVTKSSW